MPPLRPQIDPAGDHGYGSIFLPLLPQQRFTSDPANLQAGTPALAAQERFRSCRPQPTLGLCPRMFRLLRDFHSPFPPHFAPLPRPAGLADSSVFRPAVVGGKQRRPPKFPYSINQKAPQPKPVGLAEGAFNRAAVFLRRGQIFFQFLGHGLDVDWLCQMVVHAAFQAFLNIF